MSPAIYINRLPRKVAFKNPTPKENTEHSATHVFTRVTMTAVTAWAAVSHSNPKHFLNAKVREHIPALLGTGGCSDKWRGTAPTDSFPVTSNQHRNHNRNMKEVANLSNPPSSKPKALLRCWTNALQSHTSRRRNKFFRRIAVPK